MKRFIAIITLLVALSVASLQANTITLTQNAYSYGNGGEFTAVASPSLGAAYSPLARLGNGFETFCVQETVTFNPGSTYSYVLANVDTQGRPLSLGTAFLYSLFASGTFADFNYVNTSIRNTDAGLLQTALWYLQGQGGNIAGNQYYNDAVTALGANLTAPNNGQFPVQIIQLFDESGAQHQNQLVYTASVPDAGNTLGLVSMALIPMGLMFRRNQLAA